MYIDDSGKKGKYRRVLLRESFREGGKVKHRTVANISHCSDEEIEALRMALKHKKELAELQKRLQQQLPEATLSGGGVSLEQGLSAGAVGLLHALAHELGIAQALGDSRQGKLALWQVFARLINQGSRLSAVRTARSHAACDILGLDGFNEDNLYENLKWLSNEQAAVEDRLFKHLYKGQPPQLFLYDVTSSYLEGEQNQLAAFGYCRDGKSGKRQIVIGLLCDQEGCPLSIEVFAGNTPDTATFSSQVRKAAERFGGGAVTFVGDRGMIKAPQIKELAAEGFHHITAITKPQIEKLLSENTLQMELFDQPLAEVEGEGLRYVLRRNPERASQIEATRQSKLSKLKNMIDAANTYLCQHPRAKPAVQARLIRAKIKSYRFDKWARLEVRGRRLKLKTDTEQLHEESKLDGCYVLKTDLSRQLAPKELVHERYKDLAEVESAFRTCKTEHLEMRPIFVRLEESTRGHALVVMLAYRLRRELAKRWSSLDLTVEEGLRELESLCFHRVKFDGKDECNVLPKPRERVRELIDLAKVKLPEVAPSRNAKVDTRKKLQSERKKR